MYVRYEEQQHALVLTWDEVEWLVSRLQQVLNSELEDLPPAGGMLSEVPAGLMLTKAGSTCSININC